MAKKNDEKKVRRVYIRKEALRKAKERAKGDHRRIIFGDYPDELV